MSSKRILYYNSSDYNYEQSGENIIYCHFYLNEKKEGIIIYLNNKTLCYKNIETLEVVNKIEISNINLNIKYIHSKYLICCQKEFLLIYDSIGSFEVFKIYNNKSEKIICIKKKEDGQIFEENFLFNTINYFNKNIYVSCFYKHKIYIYNILLNQSEIVMDYNEEIMSRYNEYFLNNKNLYDFLFVTTDKKCYIYELKNFSIKKKLLFKNIFYVLLSEIFNKNCFIISYDETISIIDFFSDDIIYSFYGGRTECLFLWNPLYIN